MLKQRSDLTIVLRFMIAWSVQLSLDEPSIILSLLS